MLHAISFADLYSAIDAFNAEGLNPHGPNVAATDEWQLQAVIEMAHPELERLELPYGLPPSTADGRAIAGFVTDFNSVHVVTRARAGHGWPRVYRYAPHSRQVTEARMLVTEQQEPEYFARRHRSGHEWLEAFRAVRRPLVVNNGFLVEMPPPDAPPLEIPLSIELVPRPCWWSNLRSNLTPAEWQKLRAVVIAAAGGECEICCFRPRGRTPDVHECWSYEARGRAGVQRLVRMIALCQRCHGGKHIGLAHVKGNQEEIAAHMMDINGWDEGQMRAHFESSLEEWERRNQVEWKLDISYIEGLGVAVPDELDRARA